MKALAAPFTTTLPLKFAPGDLITDGLVDAVIKECGDFHIGPMAFRGYRVTILSGHERGRTSLISQTDARPLVTSS